MSISAFSLPHEFPLTQRTVPALLLAQARLYGDRVLFVAGGETLHYSAACEVAASMAGALRAAGVRVGDRVALMCGNRFEFMRIFLGCAWLGAIAVPINTASRGPQLQHILRNCGARLMAIEASLTPVLGDLQLSELALSQLWMIGEGTPQVPSHLSACSMPHDGATTEPHAVGPGDTLVILYTSGTTGPSKAVCCPHAQYFWWGVHTAGLLGLREGEVLLSTLPLFHTNALNTFFQALLTGSTFVSEPRFSVSGFTTSLVSHRATVVYLLGAMVPMLLSRPANPADRDHSVRITLAPGVPAQFHRTFTERFGIGIIDGYGSTETNFVIGATLAEQLPDTMGRVRPGFQARVVNEVDEEVPDGQPGELILRADEPFAFSTGYFQMAAETVAVWRNLWFHTGDRAIRESDGRFRFIDRMKDSIRRRGENISSHEVEQVITSHPAVAYAAAFAVKSELAEDEVMVAVVLREHHALTAPALLDHCTPRLPYFAVPRYVEFLTELPANESGKIQKFKLRERGVAATTWDREAAGYALKR
jgi:crotonobetaine/carnitine-CoA ligase